MTAPVTHTNPRSQAREASGRILGGGIDRGDQIRFVNVVIDCLTISGTIDPARMHASLFTDVTRRGPEDLLDEIELDELFRLLDLFRPNLNPVEGLLRRCLRWPRLWDWCRRPVMWSFLSSVRRSNSDVRGIG